MDVEWKLTWMYSQRLLWKIAESGLLGVYLNQVWGLVHPVAVPSSAIHGLAFVPKKAMLNGFFPPNGVGTHPHPPP